MPTSDSKNDLDFLDSPIGVGNCRRPSEEGPIEAVSGDVRLRLKHSRLRRDLPQSGLVTLEVATATPWREVAAFPKELLAELAGQWRKLLAQDAEIVLSGLPRQPTLCLRRHGLDMDVLSGGQIRATVDAHDMVRALEIFGNALAARLPRHSDEATAWYGRLPRDRQGLAELESQATKLTVAELEKLGIGAPANSNELIFPGDVRLAARLAGGSVPVGALAQVFDVVRASHGDCGKIDDLADRFDAECRAQMDRQHMWYDKGYTVARWLRGQFELADRDQCDIEKIFAELGVDVRQVDMTVQAIDAIAAWGDHGPVVVVNSSGERAHDPVGRRNTLAHELCHLVVDRGGALPFSEIKGDSRFVRSNENLEKRANACAAELLLPQEYARAFLAQRTDVEQVVGELCRQFDVSKIIVLRQLENSRNRPGGPTDQQMDLINRMLEQTLEQLRRTPPNRR